MPWGPVNAYEAVTDGPERTAGAAPGPRVTGMATTTATTPTQTRPSTRSRPPWWGLGATAALVLAAFVVPPLTGWDVHARGGPLDLPPLHGFWQPKVGPGTAPALLVALLGWWWADRLAHRLSWRALLATAYAGSVAWAFSLALVDGRSGLTRALGSGYEYLPTARSIHDVPAMLHEFVSRISYSAAPDNWPTHVAGHPPGAVLFFVWLDRLGLGGDVAAGVVVTLCAASTAVAVLVALRALGAERVARTAAPYLVLTPAVVFMAVSADGLFAAVAAWGLAALAVAGTRVTTGAMAAWSAVAGLVLGWCVLMSYGLALLGLLALAVLWLARSWRPLPIAVAAALVPVLVLDGFGFALWEAYPALSDRYWAGIARVRPAAYWLWGDLAALLVSAGPALGAGLAALAAQGRRAARAPAVLVAAAAATVVLADASRMSKGEVERIWLPFVPWLTLALVALPERWRRPVLALQLLTALLVQHLLYTTW